MSQKLGFSFNVSVSLCHLSRIQGCLSVGHAESCRWQFLTEQDCPSHCAMFRFSQILHSKSKSPSVFVKIQKFTNLHFCFISPSQKGNIISITMFLKTCARCFLRSWDPDEITAPAIPWLPLGIHWAELPLSSESRLLPQGTRDDKFSLSHKK